MSKKPDGIKAVPEIPGDVSERLDLVVKEGWKIFVNQFLNEKYKVELEAPFQLHFASVLKLVGELYCLKKGEVFFVDLESKYQLGEVNDYVDITCGFIENGEEKRVPIELKFKTKKQSAEDEGAMQIYKDIYDLEKIVNMDKKTKFAYFFMITDDRLYAINNSREGNLRYTFNTSNGHKIESGKEYKHEETKTGKRFYEKYGAFTFTKSRIFEWEVGKRGKNDFYFLKMKVEK
ncbi:hypothetical protein [Mesoaciditoga lauensis]|uniref:hypothetical protein n=1 Tax=Mesoaciditoga lauensis TaxID=1495039 RepID=UPI000569CA20|nr:hypothetical protein [Mesoaciditoga lauensis]